MASRYDELDASTALEQQLARELREALGPRGCEIVHHGTNHGGRHSPGGKPDIEIRDHSNSRLILVEVTKRRGSAADGEFPAISDHLQRAVDAGGYAHYGMLYVSPATSARMSTNVRDLFNRTRERDGKLGRIVALDFEAAQLAIDKLKGSDSRLYPAERLGDLLSSWSDAIDDARARELVQRSLFPEDTHLAHELAEEAREFDAAREKALKVSLAKVENEFRSHGITGNNANITLVHLAFLRLFEERRQRITGQESRFTQKGFTAWRSSTPETYQAQNRGRMIQALLGEIAADSELKEAKLLQSGAVLHEKLTDDLIEKLILPIFDEYDFHAGRVDILGAVFETLARRGDKDTRVGQFFTPQQVVDFCADLVALESDDYVLDPAVGTGRFLIAAMDRMLRDVHKDSRGVEQAGSSIRQHQLLGSDIDGWVSTIAKMNMFIHGDGKSGIATENGLVLADTKVFTNAPSGLREAIDVVLTNPPLGDTDYAVAGAAWSRLKGDSDTSGFFESLGVVPMETVEQTRLDASIAAARELDLSIAALENTEPSQRDGAALKRAYARRRAIVTRQAALNAALASGKVTRRARGRSMKGSALFLGAILNYLKTTRRPDALVEWQGGAAAVVVDEAILNTPDHGATRAFIRENYFVKAVISLSRDAFKYLAHTDAKTSILYLIKKPNKSLQQREPVFFAHAERVGYSAVGAWVGDDLPRVLEDWRRYKETMLAQYQGRSLTPESALLAAQNHPDHGNTFFVRPSAEADATSVRLDFYGARFQHRREELIARYGSVITVGDVLELAPLTRPDASRTGEYSFAVATRTGTIAPKGVSSTAYSPSDLWVVQEGELVLSSIDLVNGAVAVAGRGVAGLVMSKEMFSYRLKEGVSARLEYIQLLLRTRAAREMLLGFTTGTSNRTRLETREALLNFPLPPLPALEAQIESATQMHGAYSLLREADERLRTLLAAASEDWKPS